MKELLERYKKLPPPECGGAIGVVFLIALIFGFTGLIIFWPYVVYYITRIIWFIQGKI